jgi:hypothetical protein
VLEVRIWAQKGPAGHTLGPMSRPQYAAKAKRAGVLAEYKALQEARRGTGLADPEKMLEWPPRLRECLGLAGSSGHPPPQEAVCRFSGILSGLGRYDSVLAYLTWNVLPEGGHPELSEVIPSEKWMKRCEWAAEKGKTSEGRTLLPVYDEGTIRRHSDRIVYAVTLSMTTAGPGATPDSAVRGIGSNFQAIVPHSASQAAAQSAVATPSEGGIVGYLPMLEGHHLARLLEEADQVWITCLYDESLAAMTVRAGLKNVAQHGQLRLMLPEPDPDSLIVKFLARRHSLPTEDFCRRVKDRLVELDQDPSVGACIRRLVSYALAYTSYIFWYPGDSARGFIRIYGHRMGPYVPRPALELAEEQFPRQFTERPGNEKPGKATRLLEYIAIDFESLWELHGHPSVDSP